MGRESGQQTDPADEADDPDPTQRADATDQAEAKGKKCGASAASAPERAK